ncbi:MAG: NmrA family NAD(P)-binding protein [Spongiibacteraceae bacterium]
MKNILVYGATGDQGYPLMKHLREAGLQIKAASRKPDSLQNTEFADVETVYADFGDLESLINASQGIDGIAMNLPFLFDVEKVRNIAANIVAAASKAGVRKIVFNTSCVVMDEDIGISAHDGRRAIEAEIEKSGLEYAVIRSTVFMDNLTRRWAKPSIVKKDMISYPAAETLKVSWVCLDDIAKCMVAALINDKVKQEKILVGGPQALTGPELADILTEQTGRKISYNSLTPDTFASAMSKLVTGSGYVAPNSVYSGMAQFYNWYNTQDTSPLIADNTFVKEVLGVSLTPFAEWSKRISWSSI